MVAEMPGRAGMTFVERDGRLVPSLPADAVPTGEAAGLAFADIDATSVGLREWLALLDRMLAECKAGLLGLVADYDTERTFSSDTFDRDYDADVAAAADAVVPALLALDGAVAEVRAVVARPRGGSA